MSKVRLKEEPVILIELNEIDVKNLFDIVNNNTIDIVYYDHRIMSSEQFDIKLDDGIYICAFVDKIKGKNTIGLYWSTKHPVLRKQFLPLLSEYNLFTQNFRNGNFYENFFDDLSKAIDEHGDEILRMSESIGIPYKVEIRMIRGFD